MASSRSLQDSSLASSSYRSFLPLLCSTTPLATFGLETILSQYARENFVNYRDVEANDAAALEELFNRTYTHSLWVLNKYSVDEAAANKLEEICCSS
ncbi:hypothetical protein Ancab_028376 [Ancistrocladus abbreviatus]